MKMPKLRMTKIKMAKNEDDKTEDDKTEDNKPQGRPQQKKNVSFRALPESPKLPPPSPQFGQLGPLFSEVKIQDLKVSLELKLLYILYNILYICNLKNC